MPTWLQIILGLMAPLNVALLTHILLTRREKRQEKRQELEKTSEASAKEHVAELDAQDKFIAQLLVRVRDLEVWQVERMKAAEERSEQIMRLQIENAMMGERVEAMKYELAGKIGVAMGAVEQRVASALIDREVKESQT